MRSNPEARRPGPFRPVISGEAPSRPAARTVTAGNSSLSEGTGPSGCRQAPSIPAFERQRQQKLGRRLGSELLRDGRDDPDGPLLAISRTDRAGDERRNGLAFLAGKKHVAFGAAMEPRRHVLENERNGPAAG